jgi:tetraacyldisaccharide 4'-kinase
VKRAAAWLFDAAVRTRHRLYEWRWLSSMDAPHPVISIGNLAVGGTGKTPLTLYLAERLLDAGLPVAVLTRGYGRVSRKPVTILPDTTSASAPDSEPASADVIGDEPWLLRQRLPRVALGVDARRRRSARALATYLAGGGVFLLDDGFQHFELRRDLDIVVVAADEPLRGGHLVPRGRLRERPSSLARADHVVVMCSPACRAHGELVAARAAEVRILAPGRPIAVARPTLRGLRPLGEPGALLMAPAAWRRVPVAAMAAIARPERLAAGLEAAGLEVAVRIDFPDHHRFTRGDLEAARARARGLAAIVTTEKDEPRLLATPAAAEILGIPVWVAVIALEFTAGESDLLAAVGEVAGTVLAAAS